MSKIEASEIPVHDFVIIAEDFVDISGYIGIVSQKVLLEDIPWVVRIGYNPKRNREIKVVVIPRLSRIVGSVYGRLAAPIIVLTATPLARGRAAVVRTIGENMADGHAHLEADVFALELHNAFESQGVERLTGFQSAVDAETGDGVFEARAESSLGAVCGLVVIGEVIVGDCFAEWLVHRIGVAILIGEEF